MPGPDDSPQPRILLVDDDDLLAESVAEYLRRHGYAVQVAREGRQALDLLARQRFALVISDIFMPEVDGIELLGLLRRCIPPPAVVAMSGSGAGRVECMLKMASVLGASRTLSKPFQPAHLIRLAQELIGPGVVRVAG
jgi:CheY-like chemotaxis protein